ncbi:DUF1704 domain-containing protein [Candidatus Gracilibacteria bacterium]|nr:DUF1704 domain-containing protein [Candidatus Gracilibacteria bacterium]MCF7819516.1 DUF1704 domain-containing protein [Candidatus Gracilibacteria bacterium]
MSFFKKAAGILGINSRNLDYIAKYNSYANKKFADNKIFTKHFLESRGIGVAKIYQVVQKHNELTSDFFDSLPNSFVIKPNRGYGGAGILVIVQKQGRFWVTASGKKIDQEFLYRHCVAILDGKYSISGMYDQVIFEERLEPHPDFRKLSDIGLPDIRVIVFNMVPVLAMLRVPTYESEGKANMEVGAVALGIDIGTGKTIGGAQYSHYIRKMPNGQPTTGFQVPFWDEILYAGSKIQQSTHIGFLGVDLVITKTGVKVLEINARSGLKIQIANKVPLKTRLEKVTDVKVLTPEDGVEVAKTLFSPKATTETESTQKPVIGIRENVILNAEKPQTLQARVDLSAEENTITSRFYTGSILDVSLAGKRIKIPVQKGTVRDADLILAGKFLTDFYIDPNKKHTPQGPSVVTSHVDEKMIRNIDDKICEVDEQIKLLSYINPRNLEEQKRLFLENPEFSPRFSYREQDLDFSVLKRDIKRLPEVDHVLYPLFIEKAREIEAKIDLIQSVGSEDFSDFSKRTFGNVSDRMYRQALDFLKKYIDQNKDDISEEVDLKQAKDLLWEFLKNHKLSHWKIKEIEESVSDIQVTKRNVILLKKGARFQENRLKALLVHEIGTHVFRFENGKLQPFRIFERGTAGYLKIEEGIAIWNQNNLGLELGDKFLKPAYQVIAIHLAKKMSFCDLFHFLKDTYQLNDDLAWRLCVKAKRGLTDSGKLGAFTKDHIYFSGHREVEKFMKKEETLEPLYIGKIKIEDLKILEKIENMKPPKFLL